MKKHPFLLVTALTVALTANAQSCHDGNHPHAIDLGLPSGTKWACCNVKATTPEGYGVYYAWGETEKKEIYNWTTYIHCDGSETTCHDLGSDIAGTEYDVAHIQWGGSWAMPSQAQLQELANKCSYSWTTKNSIDGAQFTGPNGSSIFLPAGEICSNGLLEDPMHGGNYWSSTQSTLNNCAYRLSFDSWGASGGGSYPRGIGLTVRPVMSETTNMIPSRTPANGTSQAVYNICGIKVKDNKVDLRALPPGIYVVNGKKIVIK